MRGLERDELVQKPVFSERWLNGDLNPHDPANQSPTFLISTSAGEVGFDLNADHMVCDATTIDSLVQRLGRVNRRGQGRANVRLVVEGEKKEKESKSKTVDGLKLAIANALALLKDVTDVSPRNIAALRSSRWKDTYCAACFPEPASAELTGHPARRLEHDQHHPTDAWPASRSAPGSEGLPSGSLRRRPSPGAAELDIAGFADLDLDEIEEWFDAHRILTHEMLSVKTNDAADWLKKRWVALPETQQRELEKLPVIINRAGMEVVPLGEAINRLLRKTPMPTLSCAAPKLLSPPRWAASARASACSILPNQSWTKTTKRNRPKNRKRSSKPGGTRSTLPMCADRYREKIEKPEDGETYRQRLTPKQSNPPTQYARYALELASDDDRTVRLVSYIPRREKLEAGSKPQTLKEHVGRSPRIRR